MRALLWLLTLAAVAVGMALAASHNEGYALLVLPPWRIEVSLNFLIVISLAAFAVAYLILRALLHLLRLPASVQAFRRRRQNEKGEGALRDALLCHFEGRYGHAVKAAGVAHQSGHAPGLAALVAMRSAHALRDEESQNMWRQRAIEHDEIRAARLLSEAEIAIDERRFDVAASALAALAVGGGRHIAALRLELRARQGLGEWKQALHLIRQLQKHRALSSEQTAPLKLSAQREWLRALPRETTTLATHWAALPRDERQHPLLAQDMARALIAIGDCSQAQSVIEEVLDQQWDSDLVALYADCAKGDSLGRIALAENWLHDHPRDAQLLLTLGRLCRNQQLWGKAESYLEASLSVAATREAHRELAQLLDVLERSNDANEHYRAAATLD